MSDLIDDLLNLSHVSTTQMHKQRVDLSAAACSIMQELQRREPGRKVDFLVHETPAADGDNRLLQIALDNLLRNAWKYTSGHKTARIEFGCELRGDTCVYFVRDDGAGFDANQAGRLFKPYQRLHSASEFPGTGVGLATVQRIIRRHGGDAWAEGRVEKGATFYFTLAKARKTFEMPSAGAAS